MFQKSAFALMFLVMVLGYSWGDQLQKLDQSDQFGAEKGSLPEGDKEKESLPQVTIKANAFEAFVIVSKLKDVKATIVIEPKKIEIDRLDGEAVLRDDFINTFLALTTEIRDEMDRKNPKARQSLKDVLKLPEGKRMDATMRIFEEYLGIKNDSKLFFERAEGVYWAWLKRDKRVTLSEKPK